MLAEEHCFSLRQLAVKGNDLIAIGLSGPLVGKILNSLLDQVVEERLPNDREMLLDFAKENLL